MGQFLGKVALITGASSGIGRATALAFAREGAMVVATDIQPDGGADTVRMIKEDGGHGVFVRADVTLSADVQRMVERAIDTFGRLDFAVNNAGTMHPVRRLTEQTEEDFDRTMAVNAKGVWLGMKYEIPAMLRNGGAVVNVSSVAGLVGNPGLGLYSASKHAVLGLTKSAALEYSRLGVRVNAVCPALVRTAMTKEVFSTLATDQALAERIREMHPIGRPADPEEIADGIVWLCSPGASFVTGHALLLDGAFTAQ